MRKLMFCFIIGTVLLSCNNENSKTDGKTVTAADTSSGSHLSLPFKALYSSSFSDNVSDADLTMVMGTYKDWQDGNIGGIEAVLADSVDYDASSGVSKTYAKNALAQLWKTYRDSLSSVKIEMYAWRKMYTTDKKEAHVVTWYKEIDTYKDGRIDSAMYHDINGLENGKLSWYSSMKRGYAR